jgi:probable F420-dependent oxidoreductase
VVEVRHNPPVAVFRWGVRAQSTADGRSWAEQAREIEALGFDTLVMADHVAHGPNSTGQFAPVPALMAAADATKALRVSAMVFANDWRNPVMLAKEMTTIDAISGGRLDVALGAGWSTEDYESLGIPFEAAGVRVERFAEAVALITRLFTEERVDHTGRFYRVHGASVLPRPTQRPHPPIVIGGRGPRVLRVGGRLADIVSLSQPPDPRPGDLSAAALARSIESVRKAAGGRMPRITLHLQCEIRVTDDAASAYEAVRARSGMPIEELRASPYLIFGGIDTVHERLVELRDRLGITYVRVTVDEMRSVAPLVARMRA